MYRLLEENRNIERRLASQNQHSPSSVVSHPRLKPPLSPTPGSASHSIPNKSPPRLPYDEMQMDHQRQQEILYKQQQQQQQQQQLESPRTYRRIMNSNSTDSDSMNNSFSSTGSMSSKERLRSRIDMDHSSSSSLGSLSRHRRNGSDTPPVVPPNNTPADRRRGRKSHPWQTDVKINRFSSTVATPSSTGTTGRPPLSSRTQQSTLGWKQRMQERRAVFGNVAVPEQSFDEDDNTTTTTAWQDDEEDEESRGPDDDDNEDQIREEAVELLKSKGFHNFQGILEHHYDDDLESVGGASTKSASRSSIVGPPARSLQHTIKLGEIQSLRQKILLEQDKFESSETLPEDEADEEEDQPFDHPAQQQQQQQQQQPEATVPEDNGDAVKAWRVMKQLKVRLKDVFTDDHFIVEAMGRKGLSSPSQTRVVIDENAFARHKLRDAVEKRVSLVFTGDHHIVCSGDVDADAVSVIQESLSGDTGGGYSPHSPNDKSEGSLQGEDDQENLESYKSPQLRERLSDSFLAFEAMLRTRQQAAAEGFVSVVEEEKKEETTIRHQEDMLPSMPSASHDDDDDQSCYSEYTIDTTTFQTGNRDSIVSTATAVPGMDDSRKTIKANNSQAANLASRLGDCNSPISVEVCEDDDEESYAEYTVMDEPPAADVSPAHQVVAPFRMPGQAQLPVQTRRKDSDDQSYMEFTVVDSEAPPSTATKEDDQSYMEFTVREQAVAESPPTRLPPQRRNRVDEESYMEVTVADQASNPSVALLSPPDLTSPHLTSMLSSRMFADMQLPPELQQQQQAQQRLDGENENYPTITIHPEDDEMTQLTFDHTMEDTGSAAQDHHYHATQYFESSTKSKEAFRSSYNNVDVTSVVGSQHTEQTRDTTVSDDGSSHQDGASFKSCISSESSQYVAELLRRDIWSPDAAVVQTALEKLGQEAMKGFHERSNIVRYGGLLAMLRSMEMKPDQPQIQMAAFAALEKMSTDASTQVAIGEVGGIPAIANSMKGHFDNISVQQAACKALSCLTRHREGGSVLSQDSIPTDGVVEPVTQTMQKHPEDADIQAHAFGTLANLCLDNQARLRELKKSGGLAAMTVALQVPWSDQADQHEAISTLSILLRSMTLLDKK